MTLLTKTQLKDYEAGEFSDIKQRTYPETRDLIEQFPWTQQRDHISISLTNPSITIEGPSGDYLKLAPYFNGKFVLYSVGWNEKDDGGVPGKELFDPKDGDWVWQFPQD